MTNELINTENDGFLIINTLDDALKVANIIAKSSFCPKAFYDKPGDVLVCMQMGAELGLKPLQALQNIAVINGRPSLWGDAMLAVCRRAANFEFVDEKFDESSMTATCIAKRRGEPEVVRTFSKDEATKAGLWGKNVWASYPKRMLAARARGFALRDAFADTLRGIISTEEAQDYPKPERVQVKSNIQKLIANKEKEVVDLITAEDLILLQEKIDLCEADVVAMCLHYRIDTLDSLPKALLPKVLEQLDKKIEKYVPRGTPEPEETNVAEFFAEADA